MGKTDIYALGRAIKLIVCDMDGTLLDSRKQISRVSLATLEKAREKGIFTTICSGRVHSMLTAYSRRLKIEGPLIAANGAVIFDTRDDKILFQKTIEPEAARALLMFCGQNGMDYSLLASKSSFFSRNSVRIRRFEQYNSIARIDGLPEIPLRFFSDDYSEALSDDIYKILVYELQPGQKKQTEAYLEQHPDLAWTSSEEGLLDISASGVNKGEGVHKLARILGISESEICVFGDYCNDIPMMERAGLPIAMGNAHDSVKKAALAVTASNDEDGVARGIEKYILQTRRMK